MSKPDRFDEEAEKLVGDICATDDIAAFGRKCHAEGLAQGSAEAFREAGCYMRAAWLHEDGPESMKEFFESKAAESEGGGA